MAKKILLTIFAICIVAGTIGYFNRAKIRDAFFEVQKKDIPKPLTQKQVQKKLAFIDGQVETVDIIPVEANLKLNNMDDKKQVAGDEEQKTKKEKIEIEKIPEEFNLDVPFTSQAPHAIWDEIHKDACEEASALMAGWFVLEKDILSADQVDREILKIVDWEKRYFGYWKDTDAEKTAEILKNYFGLKDTEVKTINSVEDIKREIAKGNPVIVPMAGRELGNPYYTPPGPYYHMLVAKGYTEDRIITNDPGTKRGKDFLYKNEVFWNAIHDWNNGDVIGGEKVMIVVKK